MVEVAADVGKTEEYKIGMITDTSLGSPTNVRA